MAVALSVVWFSDLKNGTGMADMSTGQVCLARATLRHLRELSLRREATFCYYYHPLDYHLFVASVSAMDDSKNNRGDHEPWSGERLFQHVKAQHDKLLSELQNESARLEREWSRENGSSIRSAAGPFSAFKKFIDDRVTTIFHALHDLPTNTAELTSRMQREQDRWRTEEQEISQRWTGSTDSPDHIQMEQSRSTQREQEEAIASAAELLDIAQELNGHIPPARVEALYRDDDHSPGILDMIGSLSIMLPEHPQWLSVDWFKRSPYSPVGLEGHPALGQHGAMWRAAFEDLLNASLDKPMRSIERVGMRMPHGRPQSTYYGPGLEWMLSLQCRGILPMQLPRLYQSSSACDIARVAVCPSAVLSAKKLLSTKTLATAHPADSALAADFQDLISAVGTKATADTEADPLPVRVYPHTEQEMYESMLYSFPGTNSPGNVDDDTRNNSRDVSVASSDRLETALLRRGFELAGDHFGSFIATLPTPEEVVEKVLGLQEQHDNLERLTGQAWTSIPQAETRARSAEDKHRMSPPSALPFEYSQLSPIPSNQHVEGSDAQTPSVLSALTTTHTTRLPDGTVTTKVVLKQRFANGREETVETVHTHKEGQGHVQEAQQQDVETLDQKRGWFWT